MSQNELNVSVKMQFDEAKAELKQFKKSFFNALEFDIGAGAKALGMSALAGTTKTIGGIVPGAVSHVKSEAELAKSLTLENIQKEATAFVTGPLRGIQRQMGALGNAKEQTLNQLGLLGGSISEKDATELFDLNFKLESDLASSRTRAEKLISGRVGPLAQAIGQSAKDVIGGGNGQNDSPGFKFSVERFEKAVDKFSKILGTNGF